MLELLANSGLFQRFMGYVGLIPVVMHYVHFAETTIVGIKRGPERKALVVGAVTHLVGELVKSGHVPVALASNLPKLAGELTELVVRTNNAVGLFRGLNDAEPTGVASSAGSPGAD